MKRTVLRLSLALLTTVMMACGGATNDESTGENNVPQAPEALQLQEVAQRTQLGAKLYVTPQPALMIGTYDAEGNPDVMMAAWGGQCGMNQVCFSLSPHRTTTNLRASKEFTLSFATAATVAESDYFGIVSANDVPDKVARAGFTVTKSQTINAPIINEYPLTLECRVIDIQERGNDGSCLVIGEVVNSIADPAILTDGKIDIKKLNPVVWDASSFNYYTLADSVGKAWNSGNKYVEQ